MKTIVLLYGACNSGKTSTLMRFFNALQIPDFRIQFFPHKTEFTVEVAYCSKVSVCGSDITKLPKEVHYYLSPISSFNAHKLRISLRDMQTKYKKNHYKVILHQVQTPQRVDSFRKMSE